MGLIIQPEVILSITSGCNFWAGKGILQDEAKCYAHKNIKEGAIMGLVWIWSEMSLLEDRAAFIAGEIGGAVVELIIEGVVIDRDAIVDKLEAKRRSVGNVIHKGLLRDAAEFARKGH
jgi:hypothetical protein